MARRGYARAGLGGIRVCVEVPDDVYEIMQFTGTFLPTTRLDIYLHYTITNYVGVMRSIYDYYRFTYTNAVKMAEEFLGRAGLLGKYDPKKVAATLGELITPIRRGLDDIPGKLEFDKLSVEDWMNIKKVITYIEGREYDPREYLIERLMRIKDIARIFAIRIIEEKGVIKGVEFTNPNLLVGFSGFIPKALDC